MHVCTVGNYDCICRSWQAVLLFQWERSREGVRAVSGCLASVQRGCAAVCNIFVSVFRPSAAGCESARAQFGRVVGWVPAVASGRRFLRNRWFRQGFFIMLGPLGGSFFDGGLLVERSGGFPLLCRGVIFFENRWFREWFFIMLGPLGGDFFDGGLLR